MNSTLPLTAALLALLGLRLAASPLDEGKVSRVVKEGPRAATRGMSRRAAAPEAIHGEEAVRVGPESRAEIRFSDHTLARLGGETILGLRRGTRELTLERGTLLLEVPGWRGGARVRIGALTAVCDTATILVEHLPAQSVKIVVLAGDLRVSSAGFFGDSIVIPPGKMLIAAPDVKFIPDPVDVDLSTLVKTSTLIGAAAFSGGAAPLASLPRMQREIARQAGSLKIGRLIPTNLAIVGSGTNVTIPGAGGVAGRGDEKSVAGTAGDQPAGRKAAGFEVHRRLAGAWGGEGVLLNP